MFLRRQALAAWAAQHGRPLSDSEQYAAAKMRLFQGLDQAGDLRSDARRLPVDAANIEDLLASLGVE